MTYVDGGRVLASGGGAAAGLSVWVVLWIATIVIGLWLYSRAPKVPGMSAKASQARLMILIASFLPCFGVNVVWVLIGYGQYKVQVRGMGNPAELQKRFQSATFDSAITQAAPRRPQPSPNPFAAEPSTQTPRSAPASGDNPFGTPAADQARPQSPNKPDTGTDNPFLR